MDLTNDQAQALFDAGCFLILTNLPEGSEIGLDGTYHTIRQFSGFKFVPPGLHLLTWSVSPSTGSSTGPGIPLRHGFFVFLQPRQKVVLSYEPKSEIVEYDPTTAISEDHLKSLDKELAPYPFNGLNSWKSTTSHITDETLQDVLGEERMLSGMTHAVGEETEKGESDLGGSRSEDGGIKFVQFRLKKSWREGAVGEEVTRYSKDKSWLLGHILKTQLDNQPLRLVGQLQLSFLLVIHLSSYGALSAYKRILALFARSIDILRNSSEYLSTSSSVYNLYSEVIQALSAQLNAIPDGSFETELPELDLFFLDEIEHLRQNLIAATPTQDLMQAWRGLCEVTKKWGWELEGLDTGLAGTEDDESDEEGEYAPQVVDL